jgi:hypothetical protein
MSDGFSERHEKASVAKGSIVLGGTVGLVAKVEVRGFPNVLGDVVGCVLGRFDERAVDVVGVARHT